MSDSEEQVQHDNIEAIERSVESEDEYRQHVQEKRQRLQEQEIEEESIDEEGFDKTTQLDEFTGRVTEITFAPKFERHRITYKDNDGNTHTERVHAALPENEESKYVRLCEWVGVDPEYPAELRGEEIPLKEESAKIDFPPIQKRLNPYSFKVNRIYKSGLPESFLKGITLLWKTIILALPAVGTFLGFLMLGWSTQIMGTDPTPALGFTAIIMLCSGLLIGLLGIMIMFILYMQLLAEGFMKAGKFTISALQRAQNFLFPKPDE